MSGIGLVAFILLMIGGLSLGILGVSGYEVISYAFGDMSTTTRVIYVLIGLAALWQLFTHWGYKK